MTRIVVHRRLYTDSPYGSGPFWKAARACQRYGYAGWGQ